MIFVCYEPLDYSNIYIYNPNLEILLTGFYSLIKNNMKFESKFREIKKQ